MRRIVLFTLFATFAFALPGWAARYHYDLESGPPVINSNPAFPPFPSAAYAISWESDHLLASPACPAPTEDISKLPHFSGPILTGTGAAAYTFIDILLVCVQPGPVPISIRVDWSVATPPGLCVAQAPFTLPFYALFSYPELGPGTLDVAAENVLFPAGDGGSCLGAILYNNETITVTDTELGLPTYLWCETCAIRLTLNPGPIYELIPTLEAVVELSDLSGRRVGSPQRVTLTSGKLVSVDFQPLPAGSGVGTRDVVPVVRFVGAHSTLPAVQLTAESFDVGTGAPNGPLVTFGATLPPSILAPQSLGYGETLRLVARATSHHHCNATLGFSDASGNRVGRTSSFNLPPGKAETLDLTSESLTSAGAPPGAERLEILPLLQPGRSGPVDSTTRIQSVCTVTSEVFNSLTGVTTSYQSAFLH